MPGSRRRFIKTAAGTALGGLLAGSQEAAMAAVASQGAGRPSRPLRPKTVGESIIVCTGDLFLTRSISSPADPEAAPVYDVLRQADASFANLENGLSTQGAPELGGFRYGPAIRGGPDLADDLTWAGVRAVSLANNHTGNYGPDALLETMSALDARGIKHAGAGRNVEDAFKPAIIQADGLTVALISAYSFYYQFEALDVATTRPGVAACRAYDVVVDSVGGLDTRNIDKPPHLAALMEQPARVVVASLKQDVDRLIAAVKSAASRADFTMVSAHLHWGRHGKHDIPIHQKVLAHSALDAGADLFVGHGPHTLRGLEWYRGKPILYSLGNFVLRWTAPANSATPVTGLPPGNRSVIARLAITRQRVTSLELLPILIDPSGSPRFALGQNGDRILAGMYGMSASLGAELQLDDWFATSKRPD